MDLQVNGRKWSISDIVNTVVVMVLVWVASTLVRHDNAITALETKLETINTRGTKYVQSEVMDKLGDIQKDLAGISAQIQKSHSRER